MSAIYDLDRAAQVLFQLSVLQEDGVLRGIAAAGNWWGGPGVIWLAALLWLGGRAAKSAPIALAGLRGAEGLAVASAISGIIKGLAGRQRPFLAAGEPWHWDFNHGWTDARYFSMPSGHTMATVAFVAGAVIVASRWPPVPRASFISIACASAFIVGFSRVYSNQHWVSDVLAAALLGTATSVVLAIVHARHRGSRYNRAMLGAAIAARA